MKATTIFSLLIFPHHELRILDYNRLVTDLNGMDAAAFLSRLEAICTVAKSGQPAKPRKPGEFGLYLGGAWYRLALKAELVPHGDPVARPRR